MSDSIGTKWKSRSLALALLAVTLLLCNLAQAQGGATPLPPPAPRSYQECDQYKSQVDSESTQLLNDANRCDSAWMVSCPGLDSAYRRECMARLTCTHNGAPEHTPCGDVWYMCTRCAETFYESRCVQQRGSSLYNQCYAQVKAYLAGQQTSGQSVQQSAAQQSAPSQGLGSTVKNLANLMSSGNMSGGSSAESPNSNVANAFGKGVAIDFKGIAEAWVEEKVPEFRHVFDAWNAFDFATSVIQLRSGNTSNQIEGIGGVAKAVLDLHWGAYELNPLSVAISQRVIDVTTTLYGGALGNLDSGMASALSQTAPAPNSGSTWNFYRTQSPISVDYVNETPAPVVDLSSAAFEDQDNDVDAGQFSNTLSSGNLVNTTPTVPPIPSAGRGTSDCHPGDRVCP